MKRPKLGLAPAAASPASPASPAPAGSSRKGGSQLAPSRRGQRAVTVYVEQATWRAIKDRVLDEETSVQAFVVAAIDAALAAARAR
ncbi:MAG: hypothetical protein JOZ69_10880 [Myxococcales bacterium]|nr:hypothetical protein [Myxococcales bacterium]